MAVVIFKWWVGDGWVVDSGDDLETHQHQQKDTKCTGTDLRTCMVTHE